MLSGMVIRKESRRFSVISSSVIGRKWLILRKIGLLVI